MSGPSKTRSGNKQANSKEFDVKQRPLSPASSTSSGSDPPDANASQKHDKLAGETSMLEEMRKMRQENAEGHKQTKEVLGRLETAVSEIKTQLNDHRRRIDELEDRVGAAEEMEGRQHRVLRYLLQRETQLAATCDDLQNRLRRNNLRIFQIPEGSEEGNVVEFVKDLLPKVLKLPPDLDIRIERAHRSLLSRPLNPAAPPRSIIVRFLDAAVKDVVLQQAWRQGQVSFQDKRIFFDQDYSPELQKRRAKVHAVIKQLKQKGVQAKCLYPARLKIKTDSGDSTFASLMEASDTLERLGVQVSHGERERLEERLAGGWSISSKKKRDGTLSVADLKAMMEQE